MHCRPFRESVVGLVLFGAILGVVFSGALASAGEPTPDAVLAELPFERPEESHRVYVNLAPEGQRPFMMLLDTGASGSVITPALARSMGVSIRRHKSSPYRKKTRLGRDLQFHIDDAHSDTGSRTGWEYGLLGGDFMDDYVVELDFAQRSVRFLDPGQYEVPKATMESGESIVPFKRSGTRILVPVQIEGETLWVLFDTGAPGSLLLSGKALSKIGLDGVPLQDAGSVGTASGEMEVKWYRAQSLRLGGFEIGPRDILVAPKGFYNLAGTNDSVLGFEAMEPFLVRIDYKRRRILLKQDPDYLYPARGAFE